MRTHMHICIERYLYIFIFIFMFIFLFLLQLEEELSQAKGNYEALNTQLMMELPILTSSGKELLILATRSLVAARMYLQGHLAKLYLQLAQVCTQIEELLDCLPRC